jgi:ABC-type transporter Mla subunit MlaD
MKKLKKFINDLIPILSIIGIVLLLSIWIGVGLGYFGSIGGFGSKVGMFSDSADLITAQGQVSANNTLIKYNSLNKGEVKWMLRK